MYVTTHFDHFDPSRSNVLAQLPVGDASSYESKCYLGPMLTTILCYTRTLVPVLRIIPMAILIATDCSFPCCSNYYASRYRYLQRYHVRDNLNIRR